MWTIFHPFTSRLIRQCADAQRVVGMRDLKVGPSLAKQSPSAIRLYLDFFEFADSNRLHYPSRSRSLRLSLHLRPEKSPFWEIS